MVFTYNILNQVAPLWAIVPFDEVKDNLIPCRAANRLPANSKSIIVFAFPYLLPHEKYEGLNISKYAVIEDYHIVIPKYLNECIEKLKAIYPRESFEAFTDNSPIPEVYVACKGGLGVKGENSLLITEKYGSFVFIGEIVTTLELNTAQREILTCIKCGECLSSCPTGAIKNGVIDKENCLSHISQKKGELTESEIKLIKSSGCAWGCDICQNVCPLNQNATFTSIDEFTNSALANILADTPIEGRAFGWRGEKVIKRNIEIIEE